MDQTAFGPTLRTSRIGFGCGRLIGGASFRESARLIETVLELGVTHFDVAPSYGLGLAEDVVGKTLGGVGEATIVTKAGIGRPRHGVLKSYIRKAAQPLARRSAALKAKLVSANAIPASSRAPLTLEQLRASFEESLHKLKRDSVPGFLLHEPSPTIDPELLALMDQWRKEGRIGLTGAGTGSDGEALPPVGEVRQFQWTPQNACRASAPGQLHIRHGLLRHGLFALKATFADPRLLDEGVPAALGFDLKDEARLPSLMLTIALALDASGIVLISSNSQARIRSLIDGVDWRAARGERPEFTRAAQKVCDLLRVSEKTTQNV